MSPPIHPVIRDFIQEAGNLTQALGIGRVLGQVYAYLYFSENPCSLDDLKHVLGISKGSASMTVRQLEQWGAVQRVWVRGDRKDYYSANDYFGRILRNVAVDILGKRLESMAHLIDRAEQSMVANHEKPNATPGTDAFLQDRVKRLRRFQGKAQDLWNNPLVKMLVR